MQLPNFDVQITQKIHAEFISSTNTLPKLLQENSKGLILYFYPKDNTQGCTLEAVNFNENLDKFSSFLIIGVSKDSIESHQNFIDKHHLNFALISDPHEQLCRYFDVIKEKTLYGKNYLGIVRSTFIFDKSGKLLHKFLNVKAKTHINDLLTILQ